MKNNKKLTKTNNYRNIRRNNKNRLGKSVNLRNRNHKNNNKHLNQTRNNNTDIIKNKFNSKEDLIGNKINKKDNIPLNNFNNTIDEDNMSNKKKLKYDFNYQPRKIRSKVRSNMKMNSIENTFNHKKNKKYLDNLLEFNTSIKKYDNTINTDGTHNTKRNYKEKSLKYYLFGKDDINQDIENNSKSKTTRENRIKEKDKNNLAQCLSNTNPNINIIDNTQDDANDSIEINVTDNNKKKENNNSNMQKIKIIKNDNNVKVNKDKNNKKNVNKLNKNHILKHNNSNHHINKKRNMKLNYYINEKTQKTIDNDNNKEYKKGINTDIFDYPELKRNNYYSLKKRINKKKSINNKTAIADKESLDFHNKKDFTFIDNSIIKNTLNKTSNIIITEPEISIINSKRPAKNNNKKSNKNNNTNNINNEKNYKKILYKKMNTPNTNNNNNNNVNYKDSTGQKKIANKRQYNLIDNNIKNLNKTTNTHNYNNNKINHPNKNQINSNQQNTLELINPSSIHNTNKNTNKKLKKKKSGQMISNTANNYKKPTFTIKNTVINVNIDTGIILSSVDKRKKERKINAKRIGNNSISHINNKNLVGLETKYNDYLANATLAKINHSNTNENFPIKTKSININDNFNLLSFNEDVDPNNNYSINKNTNFKKFYIYGEKTASKKKQRGNNIKESRNDNNKINNNNSVNRGRKHMKYKSMKLDDFYENKY